MNIDPKKSYRTPTLVVYGDLRRLTAAKAGGANDGGGAKPNTKSGGAST